MFCTQFVGQSDRMGEVQESHHTVDQVLENAMEFKVMKAEGVLMVVYVVLSVGWLVTNIVAALKPVNKLEY
jgi:phage-related minor tail protein